MPDDSHLDRRIRRTRRGLAAALIALTNEQPYESITIRDITDRADIGYATFFRHYDGKDDLMLSIFTDITVGLEAMAARTSGEFFENEGLLLFQHVQENDRLYRSILDSRMFTRKLHEMFVTLVESHMIGHAAEIGDLAFPLEIAVNHTVNAILGLIDWWLQNEMTQPVEVMAGVYERLIVRATWHALPADHQIPLPWDHHP